MTLGTICARGGSKGVFGKNIRLLAGHPLIAYTITTARACPFIDRVIVSTDSLAIAAVARRYGAEVPFMRPAALASDTTGKIPVLQHAVREVERAGWRVDLVVDLDPTSPLRLTEEVARCWKLVQTPAADVVLWASAARALPAASLLTFLKSESVQSTPSVFLSFFR